MSIKINIISIFVVVLTNKNPFSPNLFVVDIARELQDTNIVRSKICFEIFH